MAFCFGSRIVTNQPFPDYLRQAAQYFSVIELEADPKFFSNHFSFTPNEKKVLRIYQERFNFRLTLHAPFVNLRLGAEKLEERQVAISILLNAIRTASDLEIKLVTFHPTTIEPGISEQQYREICLYEEGSISILLKEARKLGVTLLIENMPSTPEYHPGVCDGSRFQELLWLFPEPEFGLTVDVGHALQAKTAVEAFLKMERVKHFHFHENNRIEDQHLGIENNREWWEKLLKNLAKNFPEAVGILEMPDLKQQLQSLQYLSKTNNNKRSVKPKRELIIPPIIT